MSKETTRTAVGAVAAAIVIARARDARHLPRLVLERDGSLGTALHIWASAVAIFGYERAVAALLRRLGLMRVPSTLASMLSLFAALRTTERFKGRAESDRLAGLLKPGVDFLGKWMGLFLAPPLASLDSSIAALPRYGPSVWARAACFLAMGWAATYSTAAGVATCLAPRHVGIDRKGGPSKTAAVAPAASITRGSSIKVNEVLHDEAVRRAWIFVGAASYLVVACAPLLPPVCYRPIGMLCEMSTTVSSTLLAKLLPDTASRVFHPLVVCAASSNVSSRFVGPVAPFLDNGRGVGDRLFQWLPAAVTSLGVRMYSTTGVWLDDAGDFRCVLATCTASGCASILWTALAAVAPQSPLSVPPPLSLPLINRSVMSALGIEGSKSIGPECDPKLSVASILITGCIGASFARTLCESCPALFDVSSPLVRGIAMGCSAHSIGTAGLISAGDTEGAAISGASMCLAGTVHTIVLQLPGVVPRLRALASLPLLA